MAICDGDTQALKKACDDAYAANPNSCSHAVWHVIKAVSNESEIYRQANDLVTFMDTNWRCVSLDDGYLYANCGRVVVGGKKEPGNGHVVVIYPGEKILSGGYQYFDKRLKRYEWLKGKTRYPRCLSTSMGSWPGAKSNGDKTVWDPWGNDSKFALVKFWTPIA